MPAASAIVFLIGYEITHTPEFMFLLHTERARKFFSRVSVFQRGPRVYLV